MNLVNYIDWFTDEERYQIMKLLTEKGFNVHEGTLPFVSFDLAYEVILNKYNSTPRKITKRVVTLENPMATFFEPKGTIKPPEYKHSEVEEINPNHGPLELLCNKFCAIDFEVRELKG